MTKKIALVTGATRGIGLETVRQLANNDIHVILAGRDASKAEESAQKLRAEKLDVESIAFDRKASRTSRHPHQQRRRAARRSKEKTLGAIGRHLAQDVRHESVRVGGN